MNDPRIGVYESRYACRLLGYLGSGRGHDGFVLRSSNFRAVKFFDRPARFQREREVYRLLESKGIRTIAGHNVPQLLNVDEELQVLEMSIVSPPFLLDFAGVKLSSEMPDFEEHALTEHYERLEELFGDSWTDVLHVAAIFERETGY